MSQKKFKKLRKLLRESGVSVPERMAAALVNSVTHVRMQVNHPKSKRGMYRHLKKKLKAQ